jgi:long-chain acyl-CoA synthetase
LSIGATVVLIPKFTPDGCLATLAAERVTFFSGVPPMFSLFTKVREPERFGVSSCKYWISGAAAIPLAVQRRFKELFGTPLHQGYGLTETSSVLTWNLKEEKPQSVGLPLRDVELEIVDDSGAEAPVGEVGEVVVRGPNVMQGYHRAPEATAAVLKDGWFFTGDLGRIDSDGDLTLIGRKKEMIIVAGENVSPEEIDEVLRSHEHVEDAAVVGVHDPLRGEAIKAFVVRKAGSEVESEDLLRYCRSKLARLKVPRHLAFVDAIPRNAAGKVLRRRLASGEDTPAA